MEPPPPVQRPGRPRRRTGRWPRLAALILAFVALGVMVVPACRRPDLVTRVQTALPGRPDLSGKPAVLAGRLAKAQAMTQSPRDALAGVTELGRLYHANGYNPEAEACWRLLRIEQPREARWCYYLADLARKASDYPAMSALLEQTVQLAPDYAPAWLQLAGWQFKNGQLEKAERSYQQRLTLLPDDPYTQLGLARGALQRGQRAEARRWIELLVKGTPQFSTGHNLYAEMLAADGDTAGAGRQRWLGREAGRFREADDSWVDELQAWCYDYEHLCVLGTIEYQTERGDRGKALFERAIELRPQDPTGYELLGIMFLKLNQADKARVVLEQGLRQARAAKPSPMFFVNLSHAYRALKQPAEAVRVVRQGLDQLGESFELLDALGIALGDQGQREESITTLRAAIKLNPNDSNANCNLAMALLAVGRADEAVDALKRSLVLQPTFPQALLLLARLHLDSGHWDEAEAYLRPLCESHPEMKEASELMAVWQLRAGSAAESAKDMAAAERHYRDGLTYKNLAELQIRLGTLCLTQGRFAEAIAPLESYRKLQPENPQGCLFLGQAYAATGRRDEARRILAEGMTMAERTGNTVTAGYCREILQQL